MTQTKCQSLLETLSENFTVALWFTGVSIARGYVVRRAFNRIWG